MFLCSTIYHTPTEIFYWLTVLTNWMALPSQAFRQVHNFTGTDGTNDIQQRKLLILNTFHAFTPKGTAWNKRNKRGENA